MKEKSKKIVVMFAVILALCACAQEKEEVYNEEQFEEININQYITEEVVEPKIQTWQDAYIEIICNLQEYLIEPVDERREINENKLVDPDNMMIYVGIHDFDGDNIPELMIGDLISMSVFTFANGTIKRIADVCMPEGWESINEVCFKENGFVMASNGSDGSGFANFGYIDGEYMWGNYSEYSPGTIVVNGVPDTLESFNEIYDVSQYYKIDEESEKCRVERIRSKKEDDNRVLIFSNGESVILNEAFDFEKIRW